MRRTRTLLASDFDAWPKTGPRAFRPWREIFLGLFRVVESGCWEWIGKTYKNGYGCFGMGTREILAHRVSYAIHKGICPADVIVRHKCDNRICINPEDLIGGTQKQNVADGWERNRYDPKKFGSGRRKIEDCDIARILSMREGGMLQRDIAAEFLVRPNQISRILSGARRSLESGIIRGESR
jgi:hypothetical protein